MEKYSKVYLVKGETLFGFRYNYEDALLEYISRWDYREVDGKWQDVVLEAWMVTDSIGLRRKNWEENPQYWVDAYKAEIDEECAYLARYI